MTNEDKPGEATSKRRSLLIEQLAELERVLEGIELDPERRNMLRAAGYRTCVGIAWQRSKPDTGGTLPPGEVPPPPLDQAGSGAPGAPSANPPPASNAMTRTDAHDTRERDRPPSGAVYPVLSAAVSALLSERALTSRQFAKLCATLAIPRGVLPVPEDAARLSEAEAADVLTVEAEQRGGWRR